MSFIEKFASLSEHQRQEVIISIIRFYKGKKGKDLERIILQEGLFSGPSPSTEKGLHVGPFPNNIRNCPNCGKPM